MRSLASLAPAVRRAERFRKVGDISSDILKQWNHAFTDPTSLSTIPQAGTFPQPPCPQGFRASQEGVITLESLLKWCNCHLPLRCRIGANACMQHVHTQTRVPCTIMGGLTGVGVHIQVHVHIQTHVAVPVRLTGVGACKYRRTCTHRRTCPCTRIRGLTGVGVGAMGVTVAAGVKLAKASERDRRRGTGCGVTGCTTPGDPPATCSSPLRGRFRADNRVASSTICTGSFTLPQIRQPCFQ